MSESILQNSAWYIVLMQYNSSQTVFLRVLRRLFGSVKPLIQWWWENILSFFGSHFLLLVLFLSQTKIRLDHRFFTGNCLKYFWIFERLLLSVLKKKNFFCQLFDWFFTGSYLSLAISILPRQNCSITVSWKIVWCCDRPCRELQKIG